MKQIMHSKTFGFLVYHYEPDRHAIEKLFQLKNLYHKLEQDKIELRSFFYKEKNFSKKNERIFFKKKRNCLHLLKNFNWNHFISLILLFFFNNKKLFGNQMTFGATGRSNTIHQSSFSDFTFVFSNQIDVILTNETIKLKCIGFLLLYRSKDSFNCSFVSSFLSTKHTRSLITLFWKNKMLSVWSEFFWFWYSKCNMSKFNCIYIINLFNVTS